jgi:hypothetical protein
VLWDDLLLVKPTLVPIEEKKELVSLIIRMDAWVSFNVDTGMLELIDIDAWADVLEKGGLGHVCSLSQFEPVASQLLLPQQRGGLAAATAVSIFIPDVR